MENVLPIRKKSVGSRVSFLLDYDPRGLEFIYQHLDESLDSPHLMATISPFNVRLVSPHKAENIINLKRINDARHINKFFEAVNIKLEEGGKFIGCFESKEQRKARILEKYPTFLAYLFYSFLDFPWKRVFPKVKGLQKIYFGLTRGHNRVLTMPEVLGRLASCGFRICDYQEMGNKTYFCAEKKSEPAFDENPTYGPFITLDRVGYKGKIIQVYKFRTMHPYAEYLQEFVYEQNELQEGGKFKDDFRITNWGKLMRKLWIDELPMLYNWLKGELKLVGVRPLSKHYFGLYPQQFQERRKKYKPALVPPFYADLPTSFEEILASEKKYMMQYDKHPILTDIKYFFKSMYNIFIKRARSN